MERITSMKMLRYILFDEDLRLCGRNSKQYFEIIEASGGIVKNESGEILFIFRNGIWDLPKGKIEDNESREEAGLREVEEECGFRSLKLGHFIGTTYHLYDEKESQY